jgi:hypothetical protein
MAQFGVYVQKNPDDAFELHWTLESETEAYVLAERLEEAGHFAVAVRVLPTAPKPRGRPSTGKAKDGAARQEAYRQRLKQAGKVELTAHVDKEIFDALTEFLKFKDETKDSAVNRALKAFLRKR